MRGTEQRCVYMCHRLEIHKSIESRIVPPPCAPRYSLQMQIPFARYVSRDDANAQNEVLAGSHRLCVLVGLCDLEREYFVRPVLVRFRAYRHLFSSSSSFVCSRARSNTRFDHRSLPGTGTCATWIWALVISDGANVNEPDKRSAITTNGCAAKSSSC